MAEDRSIDADGSLNYKRVYGYGYDSSNNLTAKVAATEHGAFAFADFHIYDKAGSKITTIMFAGEQLVTRTDYDTAGRIVKQWRWGPTGLVHSAKYQYGKEDGNLREIEYFDDAGGLNRKQTYRYDATGKLMEQIDLDYQKERAKYAGYKTVHVYEYDDAGDWIKKTSTSFYDRGGEHALKDSRVTERQITYW